MEMEKENIIKIICGTLLVLIFVLLAYIFYIKPTTDVTKSIKKSDDTYFDLKNAEQLLEEFGMSRRNGCTTIVNQEYNDTFKALVAIEKVKEDQIIKEDCSYLYTKSVQLDEKKGIYEGELGRCTKETDTITYNDANEVYKKLYNEDMPAESINGLDINSMNYVFYDFIEGKDVFAKVECSTCGGTCSSENIRKIKSANIEDGVITIKFYDYETGYMDLENGVYKLTTDRFNEEIACSEEEECIKAIKTDYLGTLNVYEAKFNKEGNNIYFKSLDKAN